MADPKEAMDDVNQMINELQKDPYAKLTDAKVLMLIKLWVRATVAMKGSSVAPTLKIFFLRKGNPGKPNPKNTSVTWKDELYADLLEYKKAISFNQDNPEPRTFDGVMNAMTGLVEDYRNQQKKAQDVVFEHQLTILLNNEVKMATGT